MITFCFLIGQGGCEPQAIAHASANMNVGNSKEFLYTVVNHLVPYLGYPRSLNALSAIEKEVFLVVSATTKYKDLFCFVKIYDETTLKVSIEDYMLDQMSFKEYTDPFTGSKNNKA